MVPNITAAIVRWIEAQSLAVRRGGGDGGGTGECAAGGDGADAREQEEPQAVAGEVKPQRDLVSVLLYL